MNMKKKHIILLLVISSIITALVLQFFDMNLTIRTILVTILMALLFSIRAVITMHDDKPE